MADEHGTNEEDSEEPGPSVEQSNNYEPTENAVNDAQDILKEGEAAVAERYEPDVEDLRTVLENVEDAIDEAQDEADDTYLGPVPAAVNYLQKAPENLAGQVDTGGDKLEKFAVAMEGVEDALSGFDIDRTRWFAAVNDVPQLHDHRTVKMEELVQRALGDDADVSAYTLEAYTSPVDDDPDARYNRPDQEVDLGDYRHFGTTADKGGGPV